MTQPKEIYLSKYCSFNSYNVSNKKCSSVRLMDSDSKYLSEEHFNSTIEKWKEQEKIWIKQLAETELIVDNLKKGIKSTCNNYINIIEEKDKEIKALKHKIQLYNNKHKPLK